MAYVGLIQEVMFDGLYVVTLPTTGNINATCLERSDKIQYAINDEVVVDELRTSNGHGYIILGYASQAQSAGIIGNMSSVTDSIDTLSKIPKISGDVLLAPNNTKEGKDTFIGLFSAGFSIFQAAANAFLLLSKAGKGTLRTNFLSIITSVFSLKTYLINKTDVGTNLKFNSNLSKPNMLEMMIGNTAKQPTYTGDASTFWQEGVWSRIYDWLFCRIDAANKKVQLDVADEFTGNMFSNGSALPTMRKRMTLTPTEFTLTFGESSNTLIGGKDTQCSIILNETGITLKAGNAKIVMSSYDDKITQTAVNSHILGTKQASFISVGEESVAVSSAKTGAVILASPIEFRETLKFNGEGQTGIPNFSYDKTLSAWNLTCGLMYNKRALLDEDFLDDKWNNFLTIMDAHTHIAPTLVGGSTSPPVFAQSYTTYGYKAIDRKRITSSII